MPEYSSISPQILSPEMAFRTFCHGIWVLGPSGCDCCLEPEAAGTHDATELVGGQCAGPAATSNMDGRDDTSVVKDSFRWVVNRWEPACKPFMRLGGQDASQPLRSCFEVQYRAIRVSCCFNIAW